eukprot:CCRYP_005988-RB/>CCRYP_005988-RB protein AED:0.42 eAED:0.45 QI:0/0/0/1/0/0/2/0/514
MSPTPSSMLILVLLLAVTPECTSLSIAGKASTNAARSHAIVSSTTSDNDQTQPSQPTSDLKALLPKPASRPLKMDKFGRRIYRMEDDNTIKLTKGSGKSSDQDIVTTTTTDQRSDLSPALSTLFQNSKEMASYASSANFRQIEQSSDLKALLPQRKMSWMTLDKFGRRLQRMEDDGTVNVKKEPVTKSESDVELDGLENSSPSLSNRLSRRDGKKNVETFRGEFGGVEKSSDLKALLPKRKMTWMKLDKLGRRVERMGDDGTVNKLRGSKEMDDDDDERDDDGMSDFSEDDITAIAGMLPDSDDETESDADLLDTDDEQDEVDADEQFLAELLKVGDDDSDMKPVASSSLKDLLPTKKPTWTKLDFKGGVVEDERRTKKISVNVGDADSNLKTLLLQAKKPTWTRLDFKGGVVEDDRRTRKASAHGADTESSEGKYTNLKTLLPERKIQWGSRGKVPVEDLDTYAGKGPSLKALLPERKFVWRNKEIGGSKPATMMADDTKLPLFIISSTCLPK